MLKILNDLPFSYLTLSSTEYELGWYLTNSSEKLSDLHRINIYCPIVFKVQYMMSFFILFFFSFDSLSTEIISKDIGQELNLKVHCKFDFVSFLIFFPDKIHFKWAYLKSNKALLLHCIHVYQFHCAWFPN